MGMSSARPRDERGFLYLEVLVGVALMGVSLLAIAPAFLLAAKNSAISADVTLASVIATDKVEELRSIEYNSLPAGTTVENVDIENTSYTRTWVFEDDVPQIGLKRVTVTVEPRRRRGDGATRPITMRLIRAPE